MRTAFILALFLCCVRSDGVFAQVKQDGTATSGDLTIVVQGLRSDRGRVQIGLFNSEETWKKNVRKFRGAKILVKDGEAVWIVENIPYGVYAVKLFHDENDNDKMDTNFLGMPTESYGFSNNVRGTFGPPGFDKASFNFDATLNEITIRID